MSDIPQKNRWKQFQWRLECFGYTFVEGLMGLLPLSLVFRFGEVAGGFVWQMMPKRRKAILRNLRIAFAGEKEILEIEQIAKASFKRAGGNLISAAKTANLSPNDLHKVIYIENPELLDEALAKGNGIILLLAHMGNWELLSRLVHLFPKGSKTGAFYRPLNNPILNQRVLTRREADGTRMFSKRDNPLHVASFLREGGIVGILADQRVGLRGEVTEFFGRLTRASPLPSLLARRSKSTVLALSLETVKPGYWKVKFVPVSNPPTTNHCMESLGQAMKTAPTDVFWLQERWRVYVNEKDYSLHKWFGSDSRCGRKSGRAVIWLTGVSEDWSPPIEWMHPDVIYEVVLDGDKTPPSWLASSARIHTAPVDLDQGSMARFLAEVDESEVLPIDFILTTGASKALKKACREELITLVSFT